MLLFAWLCLYQTTSQVAHITYQVLKSKKKKKEKHLNFFKLVFWIVNMQINTQP